MPPAPVPETALKKRTRDEEWAKARAEGAAKAKAARAAGRKDAFKRAESYVKEYRAQVRLLCGGGEGVGGRAAAVRAEGEAFLACLQPSGWRARRRLDGKKPIGAWARGCARAVHGRSRTPHAFVCADASGTHQHGRSAGACGRVRRWRGPRPGPPRCPAAAPLSFLPCACAPLSHLSAPRPSLPVSHPCHAL
jgi:hypothetical protein